MQSINFDWILNVKICTCLHTCKEEKLSKNGRLLTCRRYVLITLIFELFFLFKIFPNIKLKKKMKTTYWVQTPSTALKLTVFQLLALCSTGENTPCSTDPL